jgi:hypothetical protein
MSSVKRRLVHVRFVVVLDWRMMAAIDGLVLIRLLLK